MRRCRCLFLSLAAAVLCSLSGAAAAAPPFQQLARQLIGADQGVYVQASDGTVLAAIEAARPVHPASVSKVATTLALLAQLGPDFRFTTRVRARGPVRKGTVAGDLLVEAGRDPFLIDETALDILRVLRTHGVRQVAGRLRVQGPLLFNWQLDPRGERLQRAWECHVSAAAWAAVARSDDPTSPRAIALHFSRGASPPSTATPVLLATHQSPPLLHIVKALNNYSNNIFHLLTEQVGGPAAVEAFTRAQLAPTMRAEVTLPNGAGAGTANRMSPRAAAAILDALATDLAARGLSLADTLPVGGVDAGTLQHRFDDPRYRGKVVGKTGTYGSEGACALVGRLRTAQYGDVTFAILNYFVPVPEARRRQDAFVQALIDATGATAWPYQPRTTPVFAEAHTE